MKTAENLKTLIATWTGEIIDNHYPEDFLKKHHLTLTVNHEDEDGRVIEIELGKGGGARKFTLLSHRNGPWAWSHEVMGSMAPLPYPRLKGIEKDLSRIAENRIEEEVKELQADAKPKRPRRPRKPSTPEPEKPKSTGSKPKSKPSTSRKKSTEPEKTPAAA